MFSAIWAIHILQVKKHRKSPDFLLITDYGYNYKDYDYDNMTKQELTSGSRVSKSFILFPLKLRCVNLGLVWRRFSPPEIRLSLNSNCNK